MKIITIILIAISLSMDAFSLALIYGTQGINKKHKVLLSIIVGIYHFVMPVIGLLIGTYIEKKIAFSPDIIVGIILSLIAIEMIISSTKEQKEKFLVSIPGYLIFGLSVSIDSLTTGIGLPAITNNYLQAALTFSLTSLIFTYIGLNLGNKLNQKMYRHHSGYIGGMKEVTAKDMLEKNPEKAMTLAIKGMLPHNSLGAQMLKKLRVYAGSEHENQAQKPEIWNF